MRQAHPWQVHSFIYAMDLVAVTLLVFQWPRYHQVSAVDWFSASLFAACLSVTRTTSVVSDDSPASGYEWTLSIEFAMIAALPVPLACLAHLPSMPICMVHRWRTGASEPVRNSIDNVALSILCIFAAGTLYRWMIARTDSPEAWLTMDLLPVAAVFIGMQSLFRQVLVFLNKRQPWRRIALFYMDRIVVDSMMTLLGALIGRIYMVDRSMILLTMLPMGVLSRIQQTKRVHIDVKTGLYTYRYLDHALSEEVRNATQSGRPLTLIFGDMDYLRDINSTYGHQVGDLALREVADLFKQHARATDVAARFGGEEFVLLLPETEKQQAWQLAEWIRSDVASARLAASDGAAFSMTISLGIASFPQDANTVPGLIKAASEAVYKAKHAGRNRVCDYRSGVAI